MHKSGNKWHFLLTETIHHKAQKLLKSKAKFMILPAKKTSSEIYPLIHEQKIDAIIARTRKIDKQIITLLPHLKVIVKHGVGYDNIDINTATEMGIPVLYTPHANFESVAEHTLALIYNISKKINLLDKEIKNNKSWPKNKYSLTELKHKCIGLIGMGRIGRRIIQLIAPLKMRVLVYDPFVRENSLQPDIKKVHTVKQLVENADIISIHCPLTGKTAGILGEEELSYMKPNAFLINTARGGIIDETALIAILQKDLIAGAALDTFSGEPLPANSPFLKLDNVILTPHVAGTTEESLFRMGITSVKLAFQVLEEKIGEIPIDHFINYDKLKTQKS